MARPGHIKAMKTIGRQNCECLAPPPPHPDPRIKSGAGSLPPGEREKPQRLRSPKRRSDALRQADLFRVNARGSALRLQHDRPPTARRLSYGVKHPLAAQAVGEVRRRRAALADAAQKLAQQAPRRSRHASPPRRTARCPAAVTAVAGRRYRRARRIPRRRTSSFPGTSSPASRRSPPGWRACPARRPPPTIASAPPRRRSSCRTWR